MHSNVWDEITNAFPNFDAATVQVWESKSYFIANVIIDVIASMEVLKLILISRMGDTQPPTCIDMSKLDWGHDQQGEGQQSVWFSDGVFCKPNKLT